MAISGGSGNMVGKKHQGLQAFVLAGDSGNSVEGKGNNKDQ
jgi:hypothetical protein